MDTCEDDAPIAFRPLVGPSFSWYPELRVRNQFVD
jgi:hypothetical protein